MNTPIIFAIGMPSGSEWMLIFLAVLLLFGARSSRNSPAASAGAWVNSKKARQEFEHEISKTVEEKDAKI